MTLFYNHPTRPKELQILTILNQRMMLPKENVTRFHNLQKGYEGELKFHKLLHSHLDSDCIVLYDLLLDSNNSTFQIDCIIIQQRNIWYLEVKNYGGDFIIKDNEFYSLATEKKISNPVNQMSRGSFLLNELQEKHGFRFPIKSYVVFVHPEFTLYNNQPNSPTLLSSQIRCFLNKTSNTRSSLSSAHYKLSKIITSIQLSETTQERLPKYNSNQLQKGMHCLHCIDGFLQLSHTNSKKLHCANCAMAESKYSAVLRSVDEFMLLFPEQKITTANIWNWFGRIISKYTIRKVLFKYFRPIGNQRSLYFVPSLKNRLIPDGE